MKKHLKNIFKKKHKAGCLGKDSLAVKWHEEANQCSGRGSKYKGSKVRVGGVHLRNSLEASVMEGGRGGGAGNKGREVPAGGFCAP